MADKIRVAQALHDFLVIVREEYNLNPEGGDLSLESQGALVIGITRVASLLGIEKEYMEVTNYVDGGADKDAE